MNSDQQVIEAVREINRLMREAADRIAKQYIKTAREINAIWKAQ